MKKKPNPEGELCGHVYPNTQTFTPLIPPEKGKTKSLTKKTAHLGKTKATTGLDTRLRFAQPE